MESINNFLLILLGIVIISFLIIFIWRKDKVGNILVSVRLSKVRFIWLIGGIFMLILGFSSIYLGIFIRKQTNYASISISPMMVGGLWLILFSTSTVFIGLKGISFSTIPFYIPLNKLSSYTLEGNRLILKRKEMSECIISINASDGKKIVEAMNHLGIKKN